MVAGLLVIATVPVGLLLQIGFVIALIVSVIEGFRHALTRHLVHLGWAVFALLIAVSMIVILGIGLAESVSMGA